MAMQIGVRKRSKAHFGSENLLHLRFSEHYLRTARHQESVAGDGGGGGGKCYG